MMRTSHRVRRTALLHPFQLPVCVCLFVVAIVFTIFPEALEHSPVSFETRGVLHHIWHYALLFGALLVLIGLFLPTPAADIGPLRVKFRSRVEVINAAVRKLPWRPNPLNVEFAGLVLLALCIALNLVALVVNEFQNVESVSRQDSIGGLGLALRLGVLLGFCIRIWINRAQPTVDLPVRPDA